MSVSNVLRIVQKRVQEDHHQCGTADFTGKARTEAHCQAVREPGDVNTAEWRAE
jgi:hypothetical protein